MMSPDHSDEDALLRSVALRNAHTILAARLQAEQELRQAKAELEQRTQALDRSLAMMKATLECTPDAIVVSDEQGRVTGFNEAFPRLWGLPRDLLAAGTLAPLLEHASRRFADPQHFLARMQALQAAPDAESSDLLELADGRVFERLSRMQTVDGQALGRVWIFRDVTAQHRAGEALQDDTRILELLHRTGAAIGSTLDLQMLLQIVTDAATQLTEARFGAFFYNTTGEDGDAYMLFTLSGAPREAFEKFGHPRATPLFAHTFNGEPAIRLDDVLADPRYGQWPPHHGMPPGHLPVRSYLAVPVIGRSGEVIGGLFFGHPEVGVFTERTQRVVTGLAAQAALAIDNARLYDQARRSVQERERLFEAERAARGEAERVSRMKDEFLATLSHELRTPLTAILGWSKVLQARHDDPANLKRGLEAIARNANAQAQLIEDLLDMNRIVSGKVRLDVQPIDLAGIVDAAVDSVRPSADARQIRLRRILDPLAGPVSGDPHRLQQVVWNLLSNAVKFTPKGGRVDVLLERVNSHLEITVNDSGIGISPEFLPHVFDRFRQADASTTRMYGGLGLGLSIVKQLVELHGGSVRAKSAGEGQGATFIVMLPLAPVRHPESRVHPTAKTLGLPQEEIRLDGVKVMVVDDEADARELIKQVLVQSHAEVATAGSVEEGLRQLQAVRPDVVISDIGMPEKDGYHFIRAMRGLPASRGGRTPAIALTAFARSEDRTRAMLAGYQVHIAKPIEPQELVATVSSLVGRLWQAGGDEAAPPAP
jgi:PAS domain S-box-containing protein